MKKTLMALVIALLTVQAQAQHFSSSPNISGGYNYFQGSQYIGRSRRNVTGGLDYYFTPPAYGYQSSYGCCVSQPIADGYAVGHGLGQIIQLFRGAPQ